MALLTGWLTSNLRLASYQKQIIRLASNKVHFRQINSNLQLLRKESDPGHKRPLVLLYAWLAAKGRHKKKYADFYLNKGFDVLHVSIQPTLLLFPKKAQAITDQLLSKLQEEKIFHDRDITVHAFSVGVYLYGEALVKFVQNRERYSDLVSHIKGHIYDSPVGRRGIPEGFPKALTKNKAVIKMSNAFITWYLEAFREAVTRHYDLSEATTIANELNIPIMFLYSKADPVADSKLIEVYLEQMRRKGNAPVYSHFWTDSPHVSHMLYHPEEYLTLVNEFLDKLGIENASRQNVDVADKAEVKA